MSIGFGFDNADRQTSRTYPNGVSTSYEYDGMSRLTRLKDIGPAGTLFDRQYSYNSANQISQIVEPTTSRTFGYDNIDRLTSVTDTANGNESYAFDAVGNRTSSHRSNSYVYQPFNELTGTQTATYGLDANGNTTSRSERSKHWSYLWDFENRLTLVTDKKVRVRYVYDALGRRVGQYGGAKGQTKFIYQGDDVLLDDSDGTQTKYLNGEGIDNKLRQTTGSTKSYFLSDHLGSTNGLTDASGNLTTSNSYDSFGNPTNANFPSRYQFTGREIDSTTGLQFNRARWYDPAIGRFISEDPIGFDGGDVNFYGYVRNNSINKKDPMGLMLPDIIYIPFDPGRWMSGEAGANFHAGLFGYGISFGVEVNPLTGQTCLYRKVSMRIGLGLFAGAGFKAGVDQNEVSHEEGSGEFSEGAVDVGEGLAEKFKLKVKGISSGGEGFAIGGGPGVGIGGSLGVDWGYKTIIKCWNTPCDKKQ